MRTFFVFVFVSSIALIGPGQQDGLTKTRFGIGLSAPELLHAGISIGLGKLSQLGFTAGIAPTWGGVWPTLNIEHRLYSGKVSQRTERNQWFFRKSATWFLSGENQSAISLTIGLI